jgi:hypothetical protein
MNVLEYFVQVHLKSFAFLTEVNLNTITIQHKIFPRKTGVAIERIGYNGDIINFFITNFSLWKHPHYASIFILCYFIDIGINKILK